MKAAAQGIKTRTEIAPSNAVRAREHGEGSPCIHDDLDGRDASRLIGGGWLVVACEINVLHVVL